MEKLRAGSDGFGEKSMQALRAKSLRQSGNPVRSSSGANPFMRAFNFFATISLLIALILTPAQTLSGTGAQVWVASWGSSQQIPEAQNALPLDDLRDATVRQIFHLSVGGSALRVHVSNAFGTAALHFTSVHVARPISSASSVIDRSSDQPLSFAGKPDVLIPPGAEFVSDPVDVVVPPLSDLAVTFHLDTPPAGESSHPGSRATTYYVHGNSVGEPNLTDPKHVDHWFQISAIDVRTSPGAATIVAMGDSITDGHGATTNGNDRWTDVLAAQLQTSPITRNIGVSNQGIGGNHLLTDGLGPNALARFDRDVLVPAGVRWLIVFEGINDIGGLAINGDVPLAEHAALVERVIFGISTDHRACALPWSARLWRYDNPVYRLELLPSGTGERT
jgi:hypothetical protein